MAVFYLNMFETYIHDFVYVADGFTPLDCDISYWIVPGTLDLED